MPLPLRLLTDKLPGKLVEELADWRRKLRNADLLFYRFPASNLAQDTVRSFLASRDFRPGCSLCYAPSNSLFFARDGRVQACCYNRDFPLGRYPDQSVLEIWQGARRQTLEQQLVNHHFGPGCQQCQQALIQGNVDRIPARQYDHNAEKAPVWPTRMDFELSNTCNLECVMCSGEFSSTIRRNREKRSELTSPFDEAFFDQIRAFLPHLKWANFLGGEPFLIPAYYRIWDDLAACNPAVQLRIQTNGSVWNTKVEQVLDRHRIHIAVSIDGFSTNVFESVRKGASRDRVMDHVRRFAAYCKGRGTFFTLSLSPIRASIAEVPELLDFAKELGALVQFNTVYQPLHLALWTGSVAQLREWEQQLISYQPDGHSFAERENARSLHTLLRQLTAWKADAEQREKNFERHSALAVDQLWDTVKSVLQDASHQANPVPAALWASLQDILMQKPEVEQHRALALWLTLPLDWMTGDPQLTDPAKFADVAGTYLLTHGTDE